MCYILVQSVVDLSVNLCTVMSLLYQLVCTNITYCLTTALLCNISEGAFGSLGYSAPKFSLNLDASIMCSCIHVYGQGNFLTLVG